MLLVLHTLAALQQLGHQVTLVTPWDPRAKDGPAAKAALAAICHPIFVQAASTTRMRHLIRSVTGSRPFSMVQHELPEVQQEIARLLRSTSFDLVQAEQLQAFPLCLPALEKGLPLVLRCHHVESSLWLSASRVSRGGRMLLQIEAGRFAKFEAEALAAARLVVALTKLDAAELQKHGTALPIEVVPVPFPSRLSPSSNKFPGTPSIVLHGRNDWFPTRDGHRWFEKKFWPAILKRIPTAALHHSRVFPAPGSVLIVPLRIGSGVRIKVLEAWARGVSVLATPRAVAGMDVENGRELRIVETPEACVEALSTLPEQADSMTRAGQLLLREKHAPNTIARLLTMLYERVGA